VSESVDFAIARTQVRSAGPARGLRDPMTGPPPGPRPAERDLVRRPGRLRQYSLRPTLVAPRAMHVRGDSLSRGPLAGIRVLELGSFIAGPFAGQLLGDYGAEIIKVEPPGSGDAMRTWGVSREGTSLWWPAIARNKKSVAVNLHDPRGQELVRKIAAQSDIVLENFRPGTLRRWQLDYERLSEVNPRIVVVHVSGFGQSGPYREDAGFGSVAEAVGGIRFTTGDPDRPPARTGISLGDSLASLFAVIGALASLVERSTSDRGQEVDVAIYEAVFALMESTITDFVSAGVTRTRSGSVLAGVAPSNSYPTADGGLIVIAANADSVFSRLVAALARPELADDERYSTHKMRGRNAAEIDDIITQWSSKLPTDEIVLILRSHGVPVGRINDAKAILEDPHFAERDMIVWPDGHESGGQSLPMNGIVPKFARTPGSVDSTGPRLGEHTSEVLERLCGVDGAEFDELAAAGVVQ
jgi:crotonobetainyl-CoA:carnitine CoA-transferase CaiB-like acyl-CoA transferase